MFNARDLLGQLLQAGMANSSSDRLGHAMSDRGLGRAGNPLSEILGGLTGALGGGGGIGGGGGGLGDIIGRAGDVFGQASQSVRGGNPLAIGGLAALAGALFGGGGGAMRGAVGGGLLAVLGSLAMQVLSKQAGGAPAADAPPEALPVGLRDPQTASEEHSQQQTALLLVRAMIGAAKADGTIDEAEKARILGKLAESDADDAARAFVDEEMQKPADLDTLVADVTQPELAVQVYAASLLAIDIDTPAEETYLQRLAQALKLNADIVARIHQTLGVKALA